MENKTQCTFADVANELIELHNKKNDNYGNSYSKLFDDLGEIAGLVPLHNKLDRLTNLVKNPNSNHFESEEDTLKDLASYAIMMLVELRRINTCNDDHCCESYSKDSKRANLDDKDDLTKTGIIYCHCKKDNEGGFTIDFPSSDWLQKLAKEKEKTADEK